MSMIQCNQCKKEISELAEVCPHCGAKTARGIKNTTTILKMVGIIVDIIAVILIIWAAVEMSSDISNYNDNNWWDGGYNYQSPLTDHEKGVLGRFGLGALFAVVASTLITAAKSVEKSIAAKENSSSKENSSFAADSRPAMTNGSWRCTCGNVNPNYTGTCSCGRNKRDVENS
ncbi:MAG: hypothetical protein IJY28_07260 [Clostridia bacterium]|nr:hypothetical protein [Clostridia bacterium]